MENLVKEYSFYRDKCNNLLNIFQTLLSKYQEDTSILIDKSFILSHFTYLKLYERSTNYAEITFLLNSLTNGIEKTTSLSHFRKPSYKSRISQLISYTTTNPGIFSQILYFALSSNQAAFSHDDMLYFFFHTFPSLFGFFISENDTKYAINLIKHTLRYHFSLYGVNINEKGSFIITMIRSFISAVNPFEFFANLDIQNKMKSIHDKKFEYSLVNGKLIRPEYWKSVLSIVSQTVDDMIDLIPLLPYQITELLAVLSGINNKFSNYLVFDIFLAFFLNNKDFYDVLKCCCLYHFRNSPKKPANGSNGLNTKQNNDSKSKTGDSSDSNRFELYDIMDGIWDLSRVNVKQLKKSILTRRMHQKFVFDCNLVFSTHDLDLFIKVVTCSDDKFEQLGFDELINLTDDLKHSIFLPNDKDVVQFKKWGVIPTFSCPCHVDQSTIGEMMIICNNLAHLRKYQKIFLTIAQKLQIDFYNDSLTKEIEEIKEIYENCKVLYDKLIESSIFVEEIGSNVNEIVMKASYNFIETRVVKNFIFLNFKTTLPLFQKTEINNLLDGMEKLNVCIKKWAKKLNLTEESLRMIYRGVIDSFFDILINRIIFRIDFISDFEKMDKMCIKMSKCDKTCIRKASLIFSNISQFNSFNSNLNHVINGIRKVKKCNIQEMALSISMSQNPDVFWFGEILMRTMAVKLVKDTAFTMKENEAIALFLSSLIEIESQ
ncbi:hypothetical protein TRFO_08044 [Tritrichomonas foetus]|uniref:Uncharacterized protein n=1 Tax=Tritrichomonas foetus TaxID=1144522 RepID=A0A1J4JN25_9EUKA|nr:hypothetical protein TRFO_08044 [Tritrichomonas foetus]|eukprot:OHT00090.1 hypothetical protein TRFO_08044 [Tritrichomonas foetus]